MSNDTNSLKRLPTSMSPETVRHPNSSGGSQLRPARMEQIPIGQHCNNFDKMDIRGHNQADSEFDKKVFSGPPAAPRPAIEQFLIDCAICHQDYVVSLSQCLKEPDGYSYTCDSCILSKGKQSAE